MNIGQAEIRSTELKKICCILLKISVNLPVIKQKHKKPLYLLPNINQNHKR